jgi:hypothetical protein
MDNQENIFNMSRNLSAAAIFPTVVPIHTIDIIQAA